MTRRDSLEKAGPETQIGSSTSDPQKLLTYGLKKKRKKPLEMQTQEEGEVRSPIKPKTEFHDEGIIGHLDLGPSSDGQKKGKGELKKLAREQGPRGENSIMVQKGEVGTKRMGKIELLEAEENRVSKRVCGAKEVPTKNGNPINGSAVTARQHRRGP